MELKNIASGNESVKGAIPLGEDIMQVARIGEVSVMQKLFETKKFNASYKDDEGITPLHVRYCLLLFYILFLHLTNTMGFYIYSGPLSITNMRCANSYSTLVLM